MGDTGLEPVSVTAFDDTGLQHLQESSAANSLHFGSKSLRIDADLSRLIRLWPTLTDETKLAVLTMVEMAATDADGLIPGSKNRNDNTAPAGGGSSRPELPKSRATLPP